MFILDDILFAPVHGVVWLAKKIKEQAEDRLYNVTALKESLQELQRQYDERLISEKEYDNLEKKLLKAIEDAQRYHEANSGGGR